MHSRPFVKSVKIVEESNVSSCKRIKTRLGRYHDGELPADERRLIERHLEVCRTCCEELAEIARYSDALEQALTVPPVPEGIVQRIMTRAHMQTSSERVRWNRLWFWRDWSLSMKFAAAGVAAVACFIGLVIGSASQQSLRSAGDEMRWVALTFRGPIVAAYVEATR
jgi:anti-sigma factor RsiW